MSRAGDAFRLLAQAADENEHSDFTTGLLSSAVSHLGVDLHLDKEQILHTVGQIYDLISPGFETMRERLKGLTPEEQMDFSKIKPVVQEAAATLIADHASKNGPVS